MTKPAKPCPICKKPRVKDHSPFCSSRCRDRDLAQWFGDGYAVPGRPAKPCPICKKPRVKDHSPFCSSRCRDRDLARWFGDGYAVPGRPASPEEIAGEIVREERD